MEEVAKSSQFIAYKNQLVKYLREFIKFLQESSYQIEEKLKNIDKTVELNIFEKIYLGEKNIIRIDKIDEEIDEQEYKQRNIAKWENIKKQFICSNTRISEVEKINEKTTEIIRKITRIANQIAESKGNVSSKKAEYKKICEMFCKTQSIEEYPENNQNCVLKCEDGNLEMPAFVLEFIDNQKLPISLIYCRIAEIKY